MRIRRRVAIPTALLAAAAAAAAVALPDWTSPEDRFAQGMEALRARDVAAAEDAESDLRERPGFESHASLLRAGRLALTEDYGGALEELARMSPEGELRTPAYLLAGECLYRQGRYTEAEEVVREFLLTEPDHPEGHRWLASIYYDLGATYAAIDELKTLIRLAPDDYAPRRLLGLIYFDFENYGEAIRYYREALAHAPPPDQQAEIRRELAESLAKEHDFESALAVLAEVEPGPKELALRADCEWSLGRRDEALRTLEAARRLAPDERNVLLLQARVKSESGEAEAAIPLLQGILRSDPHDFEARYQLALAYRRQGRDQEYDREMADMLASRELVRQLSELNKEAMERPYDAEVRAELSRVCERLGKTELAEIWSRAAEACRRRQAGSAPAS